MTKPANTLIRPLVTLASIVLLAAAPYADAVDFTYQPLTGPETDTGVLYNVAISGDIVVFSIDTGRDELWAYNVGLGQKRLLSSAGFWTQNTPAVVGHHLYIAHDFKNGTPFTPTEIVDFNLRTLTSSVIFSASGFDVFESMDVAWPNLAALRFANNLPSPFYTHQESFELYNLVTGERSVIESIDKANLYDGDHIRDTAFDGNFAAWIRCPDYGCSQGTLWARDIATGERYEILSTPPGTQIRWIDMRGGILIYTHGPTTGLQPTTISAVDLVTGQMWDIYSSAGLVQYQKISGTSVVWESYEPPSGCTGNACYSVENVFHYDLTTGAISKITNESGRHYFQALEGDRVAYIDNVAGFERMVLAETSIPTIPNPDTQRLCDAGREILSAQTVVRSGTWSSVTDLEIPAATLAGPSALCVRNGDAAGGNTAVQAEISVDGVTVVPGLAFNNEVRSLAVPLALVSGRASVLSVDLGGIPGTTMQVRVTSTWPDMDGDGFASDVDCNDSNPAINPGARDVYDGIDNDCNPASPDGQAEAAITNLAARAKSGQVQLTWRHMAPTYAVYRSTTQGGPYARIGETSSTYATYLDTGLVNGRTYYYVVKPVGGWWDGFPQSNEASATPRTR